MYNAIRKIHLYTAMSLMTFVAMYIVTGFAIIHDDWFPTQDPEKSIRKESLHYGGEGTPDAHSIYLQKQFDLRGKRLPPQRMQDGRWRFRYTRPGVSYEVIVSARGDSVQITRSEWGFRMLMGGFHSLRGYGDGWLYNIWAFMYDLASLALILFAFSGIYMWYKLTRGRLMERLLGWVVLGLSFSYTTTTVLYLVYGR